MSYLVTALIAAGLLWWATDWRIGLAAYLLWTTWPNYEGC